jgi:predicted lipid-binding transport protein (Tim44 family)
MKKILAALIVGISLAAISLDASAARLGGGSSIGRSMSMPKAPAPAVRSPMQNAAPKAGAATAAGGAAAASKGMGLGKSLLIGAASALGIMALANMLGFGEGFGQMMMVVLLLALAYFALRMFFGRRAAAPASSAPKYSSNSYQPEEPQQNTCRSSSAAAAYQPAAGGVRAGSAMDEFSDAPQAAPEQNAQFEVPAEFDKENFLNMSTAYFKMLQKAWDSGDMDGLNNYCTQEMFVALTHKRREIKGINLTEVMQLEATLAGFETLPTEYVASVKFRGTLKENGNPVDIEEIWNLVKPKEGKTGWMLAGIQQVA